MQVRHEAVPESSPSKLALETKKLIETESIVTLPLPPPIDTKGKQICNNIMYNSEVAA